MSDPLGRGWNLLGLHSAASPAVLNMGAVWHTQVAVLLAGHVISVYLAHRTALRLLLARRQVIASQVPLLLLMVGYTVLGLWILSLPLGAPSE